MLILLEDAGMCQPYSTRSVQFLKFFRLS
jgi:hypothetical protein